MQFLTSRSSSSSPAVRRVVARVAAVTAAATMAFAVGTSGLGSATGGELAVNALAPEIKTAATEAVQAYDVYVESGELADYLVYAEHRTETARLAARQLGYVEYDMIEAWRSTSMQHQRAVLATMNGCSAAARSLRMRRVASKPSIPGICKSISTTSYRLRSRAATASTPLATASAR